MNTRISGIGWLAAAWLAVGAAWGGETLPLDEGLEFFRPYLGRTWRGEFKNSTAEKPMVDVARWERALNGKAVRVLHSLNDGAYGGESILRWDPVKKEIVYHYFTTAGFMTTGSMKVEKDKVVAVEKVSGVGTAVTEVRSTTELKSDGTMHVKAEYLKDGEVTGGREAVYREDPKAEVRFK